MIYTKVLIEKVLCIYLVWVYTTILLYYLCASLVCQEWYLKDHRTIQITSTLSFILLIVYAALILFKRAKVNES